MITDLKPDSSKSVTPGESVLPTHFDTVSGPGFVDVLVALAERKWFILAMTLAGAVLMVIIAFLIPPTYTATATILPPQQQQSTASALLGQLAPIAAVTGANLGIKAPADLYVGMLGSRTIADELIRAFDLRQVYRKEAFYDTGETVYDAEKKLRSRSSLSVGLKDQLIRVSVEDRDPKRAAALANAYVDQLYKLTNRLALTESAQRRLFFERQMEPQKKALADSEAALKATQERTGVLQVNSQVESIIFSMAQLRAQIASHEVGISALKTGATAQNPEVIKLETELTAMREQLKNLESRSAPGIPGDPLIPTSQVPKAGLEYVRALRDLKYNETLFELLAKQYEAARIDEAKEAPIIQAVDVAVPPERRSWPPRTFFIIAGALCSGFAGCVIAFIGFRDPEGAKKFRLLWRTLFSFRGKPAAAI